LALILNIDTATTYASVCISNNEHVIGFSENAEQKEHASFLHVAINLLAEQTGFPLKQMDAVAVTSGPGSYTGLRVGMAAAKGICYALKIPLIAVNTLEVMTRSMIEDPEAQRTGITKMLFCPMIDARRMEVFTALYNSRLDNILAPTALELNSSSFLSSLNEGLIAFYGSGSLKFSSMVQHRNALFFGNRSSARHLATLALRRFHRDEFSDLAYTEPFYAKEFYSTQKSQT
jgi:tRNA threonylcarbamoyladenosine biosynthesis protein TsaB